jgi:hypothetical protein
MTWCEPDQMTAERPCREVAAKRVDSLPTLRARAAALQRKASDGRVQIQLSIGLTANLRTRPVIEGAVKPDSLAFVPIARHASELFSRQLRLTSSTFRHSVEQQLTPRLMTIEELFAPNTLDQ